MVKYRNYDANALEQAVQEYTLNVKKAITKKGCGTRAISKKWGVPASTIQTVYERQQKPDRGDDRRFALSKQQEERFVNAILEHNAAGKSLRRHQITAKLMTCLRHIPDYASTPHAKRWQEKGVSMRWLNKFMTRHADRVRKRVEDQLDPLRGKVTETQVKSLFEELQDIFTMHPNLPKGNICNLDETGLQPIARKEWVAAAKGARRTHSEGLSDRWSLTVLATIFADGDSMPPLFIVKGKQRLPSWWTDDDMVVTLQATGMSQAQMAVQPNAWMNTDIFNRWFQDMFLPWTASRRSENTPMVLIMDNFGAHCNPDVIDVAPANHVYIVLLPAHSSHLLQPLDVGIMKPFKDHKETAQRAWSRIHSRQRPTEKAMIKMLLTPWLDLGECQGGRA